MKKYLKRITVLSFILSIAISVLSQESNPPFSISINDNWKFHQGGVAFASRDGQKGFPENVDKNWKTVSLPHTWNSEDPFDEKTSYTRGIGWYRKYLYVDSAGQDLKYFLTFEGANQKTDVYVNGIFAGQHKGGYTGFTFDITEHIKPGAQNLLAVKVDNSHDNTITPLSIGFALYGGIYRDVWLKVSNPVHFSKTHHGSSGIYLSTPEVSERKANLSIRSIIENDTETEQDLEVCHTVINPDGKEVLKLQEELSIHPGKRVDITDAEGRIKKPQLWSPENPALYRVISTIKVDNNVMDKIENPLGFRWFKVDPENGFYLNGKKYILKGTNRHQDYQGLGIALQDSLHITDLKWIKNMGANFLRLAHYPQDPVVLQTADSLGLLIWVETPNVNYIVPSEEITRNAGKKLLEMIHQGYNNPSVIFWGSSNELFLWDKTARRESKIEDLNYQQQVRDFIFTMDSLIRITDPYRISTLAIHGSRDYDNAGITDIPGMVSINNYAGWYFGSFPGFGNYLDSRRRRFPDQVLFVSEYGAGSDGRINSVSPERFDFSIQYQQMYHKSYLKQIKERPYLAGTAIWSQYDFSQPHTGGSIYHINQKGMQKWDRTPKDIYYFYKANWNEEPMVYIASRDWINRSGWNGKSDHSLLLNKQEIKVYSNLPEVELFVNGVSQGKKKPDELMEAVWNVQLEEGVNKLTASAKKGKNSFTDAIELEYTNYNLNFKDIEEIAINAGFNCEFLDESGTLWLPDQKYTEGHYGRIDGQTEMIKKDLILKGIDDMEPVYNYYIKGLSEYRLDIPDGTYKVTLLFADGEAQAPGERIFDVSINGKTVLEDFDMVAQNGFGHGLEATFETNVNNSKGLHIGFQAVKGNPLLSGVLIKKI
ncbi:MAG TPA: glycoside hydrolase family 2 TIM barrel-domain containing protein [Bacteroidales bacterium]|nr:glycoside hydrolase family 2 TIM barrel-domain containing protein [Bacteroidales bacterium]